MLQRLENHLYDPVGDLAAAVAAVDAGGVPHYPIVGQEHGISFQVALHGDQDVVPINRQGFRPENLRRNKLFPAISGYGCFFHSTEEAVPSQAAEAVAVADQLESGLLGVVPLFEIAVIFQSFFKKQR